MNNRQHVDQCRQGLEDFLRKLMQNALLLSDSSLHLFLQSHLNSEDIEACVSGQTKYSVGEAIHKFALMKDGSLKKRKKARKTPTYSMIQKFHPLGLDTVMMTAVLMDVK